MTDFKEEMRAKESVLNGEVIVLPLLNMFGRKKVANKIKEKLIL